MGEDAKNGRRMAEIRHLSWMIRHCGQQRNESQRLRRTQAIQKLGLELREAFSETEDFEPLLAAILHGLNPKDPSPF